MQRPNPDLRAIATPLAAILLSSAPAFSGQGVLCISPDRSVGIEHGVDSPRGELCGRTSERTDDCTLFPPGGAFPIGGLVARPLLEANFPSGAALGPGPRDSLPGRGSVVGLDNFFNNEWRPGPDGSKQRFHYLWEDSTNSGFSILGKILESLGFTICTIRQAPERTTLDQLAIYTIVDPDTPREAERPNVMNEETAGIIEGWVRDGGILLLLANDTGNCDLQHLNILAGRFGIRFNEDSHHRVQGADYETGANACLPTHPMFEGVRKIFTKEISSLTLTDPAQSLLTEGDLVLMGVSRAGKGTVVAVGDPWLYNEYMDNRRLPVGFDNPLCAGSLFRWIATLIPDRASRRGSSFNPK